MSPQVKDVRYLEGHRLELLFADGLRAVVDFEQRVKSHGGVWKPLHDPAYFRQVRIEAEAGTLVWPNGVDVCPDVLYALASGKPLAGEQLARAS